MRAITAFADSRARTSYSSLQLDPAVSTGSIASTSQTVVEGDQVVARARTTVSDLSVLAGLLHVDSVVTDIVATSNGTDGATSGTTTVSGATVLGLPVTITRDGISFDERPDPAPAADPTGGALDGLTGPAGDALGGATDPLDALLAQVGAGGDDALQQLFEASGIEVKILDPTEAVEGGSAERSAGGLSITMFYDGANTPVLTDLLALLPSDSLPADNLGPIPFSPQALVKLLEKQHINGLAVAPATTSAVATPAFAFEATGDIPVTTGPDVGTGGGTGFGGGTGSDSGFSSATPDLPPAAPARVVGTEPTSSRGSLPLGDAIPALAVLAVLLGSPFFGAGSRRLADNTLAAVGTSCPDGLDLPPTEAGS